MLISVDFAAGPGAAGVSVDFAAGAGVTVGAGVADGAGVAACEFGDMPSAAAPPIIKAVMAVVIMSFFSIQILLKPSQESRIPSRR
jgi:hypothetical protein